MPRTGTTSTSDGDLEKPEFLAYYVKDGRVLAAAGLDRDKDGPRR